MITETNSLNFGDEVREQHAADVSGTYPGTSVGRIPRSSGKITPKYRRRPPSRPVTTKNQTRPRPEDITGIASDDDPSVDPKRIPDDLVEVGLRMLEEIKANRLAREELHSNPVQQEARAILGSRARTHGGVLIALAKDSPETTHEA